MAPDPDHQTSSVLNVSGRKLPVEHPWFQDPGTQEKTLGAWVSAFAPLPTWLPLSSEENVRASRGFSRKTQASQGQARSPCSEVH